MRSDLLDILKKREESVLQTRREKEQKQENYGQTCSASRNGGKRLRVDACVCWEKGRREAGEIVDRENAREQKKTLNRKQKNGKRTDNQGKVATSQSEKRVNAIGSEGVMKGGGNKGVGKKVDAIPDSG